MVQATRRSFSTPLGKLQVAATNEGIVSVVFPGGSEDGFLLKQGIVLRTKRTDEQKVHLATAKVFFDDYFAGFETVMPYLSLFGTPFQIRVLRETLLIGYGATCTYTAIAHRIAQPKGARAVGRALHGNPIPLLIPCHRVIGKDGGLGGFAGGSELKSWLLENESENPEVRGKL